MHHGIKKETFMRADTETRAELLFDFLDNIYSVSCESNESFNEHMKTCSARFKLLEDSSGPEKQKQLEERLKKLENRRKLDTAISGGGGVVGGIIATIFHKIFG